MEPLCDDVSTTALSKLAVMGRRPRVCLRQPHHGSPEFSLNFPFTKIQHFS